MFSWTIDNVEYHAPMGYGEITIGEYEVFMQAIKPANAIQNKKADSRLSRLLKRIGFAQDVDEASSVESTAEYDRAFVQFWLKLPDAIADAISDDDAKAIHIFLSNQWSSWKPEIGMRSFRHNERLWLIEFSDDAIANIADRSSMQAVMAALCKDARHGGRKSARYWGDAPLAIGASVMAELHQLYKIVGTIAGKSIIDNLTTL